MTAIQTVAKDWFSRFRSGFTLVEMMMVVVVLAIVLALAAPNLWEFVIRNRLDTAANEFVAALSLARSEAIRRGQSVAIRRKGTTSQNWTEGWEVYVERDEPGSSGYCQSGGVGEEVIRESPPLSGPLTLRSTWGPRNCVVFFANGRSDIRDFVTSPADDAFVLCHGSAISENGKSRSRAIVVNRSGRIRMGEDRNGDGYAESDRDRAINNCTSVFS